MEKVRQNHWEYVTLTEDEYAKELNMSVEEYRAYHNFTKRNMKYIENHKKDDGHLDVRGSWELFKKEKNLKFK